jgi:hypothetical protein
MAESDQDIKLSSFEKFSVGVFLGLCVLLMVSIGWQTITGIIDGHNLRVIQKMQEKLADGSTFEYAEKHYRCEPFEVKKWIPIPLHAGEGLTFTYTDGSSTNNKIERGIENETATS